MLDTVSTWINDISHTNVLRTGYTPVRQCISISGMPHKPDNGNTKSKQ